MSPHICFIAVHRRPPKTPPFPVGLVALFSFDHPISLWAGGGVSKVWRAGSPPEHPLRVIPLTWVYDMYFPLGEIPFFGISGFSSPLVQRHTPYILDDFSCRFVLFPALNVVDFL